MHRPEDKRSTYTSQHLGDEKPDNDADGERDPGRDAL